MISIVHTHYLAVFIVEVERLVWLRVGGHRVEMVSRPNDLAVLGRGHRWKLGLGSQVFVG